ncbi:MAG: elongation factor G [Planctomycetes bacterium]|nr:elongation factor G [Planctomycetota bacterium]
MANYAPADIRNVAFIGAGGSGKTTLVEMLLHKAGALPRRGSVAEGSSFVDFDPAEQEKTHSLLLKVFHCVHAKRPLNLLDSPGYPDFIGEALATLYAVETAAVCVSAVDGVTFQTQRLWNEAASAGRSRIVVVTRVDAENIDLGALVASIREALGKACVPVNLPVGVGAGVSGVVDLLTGQAPQELADLVASSREQLVDSLVSLDDAAMEKYLETGEVPLADLLPLMRRGVAGGGLTPILFAAADKGVGITEILDFVVSTCPSPLDRPCARAVEGTELSGELVTIDPRERTTFSARAFKTFADPYVGRLSLIRVVSGAIKTDDPFLNPRIGRPEKMGNLLRPSGKEHEKIESAQAGDIIALVKAEAIETNDTLCSDRAAVRFPPMQMPTPIVALAVSPKSRNDEQKLSGGLRKVAAEDPTFAVDREVQTGELVVRGISMMHIETLLKRLSANYKIEVETRIPKIPMRETITGKADGHHRHKKQTGGRGQFGEVYLRVAPRERGSGFEFKDETFGGSIPRQFLPAIEKGIIDQMGKGVVAGYPVVDVLVEVYDGKAHDVDSDEASFKIAGARAFRNAFESARPVLLEPVVNLEVAVPSRFMGDINSDLNSRRGRISGMDSIGNTQVIKAQVPLKEVQSYAADLRSLTQGEGSYAFAVSHYDIVPHKLAEELMTSFKAGQKAEED